MRALAARCLAHARQDGATVTAVPGVSVTASPEHPFVALAIEFELDLVRDVLAQAGGVSGPRVAEPPQRGLAACPVTPPIRDIASRLLDLLDTPEDIPALAPLYLRELLYHVLKGPRGGFLRAVAMGTGHQSSISDVLTALHADCTRPITVPELAAMAGMSESVFYEAFKSVTASTPIQYIKRLRLQEAYRQLTLGVNNVSGAAYGVGYGSLAQFSREFTRVFGANPSRYLPRERGEGRAQGAKREHAPGM